MPETIARLAKAFLPGLAPEQYEVEITGRSRPQVRRDMLNAQRIPAKILAA